MKNTKSISLTVFVGFSIFGTSRIKRAGMNTFGVSGSLTSLTGPLCSCVLYSALVQTTCSAGKHACCRNLLKNPMAQSCAKGPVK